MENKLTTTILKRQLFLQNPGIFVFMFHVSMKYVVCNK